MTRQWLRLGLIYGIMALSIGTILAAIRTLLMPSVSSGALHYGEVVAAVALIVASGMWLLRQHDRWTTNTTLDFGCVGACVYAAGAIALNWAVMPSSLHDLVVNATLTHGILFPAVITIMSLAPAVMTQRA